MEALAGRAGMSAASLDEEVSYLSATFQQSPVGLAMLDTALRYVAVNPALARSDGYPVEDHLGRRIPELLPDLDVDVEEVLRRVLRSGEPIVGLLVRGTTPAEPERSRCWEASYYRLEDRNGNTLGVSMSVEDVTPREESRAVLTSAQSRLDLLNDASVRIGTSLDLERTASELAELAVPRFADLAVIDLLESVLDVDASPPPAGHVVVRRVAAAARPPGLVGRLAEPLGARFAHVAGDPVASTLSQRRATLHQADDAVGPSSVILAPLVARGRVLGLATFTRLRDRRGAYDRRDVALAEELAARAAMAVDNGQLYRRERTTALALQRALLPHGNPRVDCVDVASRYRPASVNTGVGGDWFDVVPLSCGRVALVVGDVMGRGLRAAAAMGQLRTAVRTLAVLDLLPDDVLDHLDHVAQSLDGVQLATCVYAVYDPVSRSMTYASAGHPPPALLRPDQTVELLETPSGAPLGVGGVPFESAEVTLPDNSTLALYTDGLVESRELDLDTGLHRLQGLLAIAPDGLEDLCDAVLHGLDRQGFQDDDVALLAARVAGVADERTEAWAVPADLTAVSQARHATATALARWGLSVLEDSATLLVSEVVTNAIRYAREPIVLRLVCFETTLVCSVLDNDARLPRLRRATLDDEGGRGLQLVGLLARRWGARPTAHGKSVWFELPLPAAG